MVASPAPSAPGVSFVGSNVQAPWCPAVSTLFNQSGWSVALTCTWMAQVATSATVAQGWVAIDRPWSSSHLQPTTATPFSTAGARVVGGLCQRRQKVNPASYIGKGKLLELQQQVEANDADVIIFDLRTIDRDEEIGVEDLPGDGFRYIRKARGIDTVIVNGQVTWSARDGYTDARAGAVVTLSTPTTA